MHDVRIHSSPWNGNRSPERSSSKENAKIPSGASFGISYSRIIARMQGDPLKHKSSFPASLPMAGFIDIHHHFFSPDLEKAKMSANSGWRTPEENLPWTPELSIGVMDSIGIQAAILSFPAFPSGEISVENRALARSRNDYVASVCRKYPARFGFFATLPFLDDVQGNISATHIDFCSVNFPIMHVPCSLQASLTR